MKKCPLCNANYDYSMRFCQVDGTPLVSVELDNILELENESDEAEKQGISSLEHSRQTTFSEFNYEKLDSEPGTLQRPFQSFVPKPENFDSTLDNRETAPEKHDSTPQKPDLRPKNIDPKSTKENVTFLEKYFGVGLFVVFVLVSAVIGLVISGNLISLTFKVASMSISVYLSLLALVWFTYASSQNQFFLASRVETYVVFLILFIQVAFLGMSVILMVFTGNQGLFWLSLIGFVYLGIRGSLKISSNGSAADKFFGALYTTWVIVGVVVTLGTSSFLPYAQSALDLAYFGLFLEIRIVITSVLVSAVVAKAMIDAYNGPKIEVPVISELRFAPNMDDTVIGVFMRSLTIVLNAIVIVFQQITKVLWSLLVHLAVFLYRTGTNIADHLQVLFRDNRLWWTIIQVISSFIILVILALLIPAVSPNLVSYLNHDTSLFVITWADFTTLLMATFLFAVTALLITAAIKLWELDSDPLGKSSICGLMMLVGWAIASLLLWCIAKTNSNLAPSFATLGAYALMMIIAIVIAIFYKLARGQMVKSKPPVTATNGQFE